MQWKKTGEQWSAHVPEGARFTAKIGPKGDGRWTWAVFAGASPNPTATGVSGNLGAAKRTVEEFLKRSGG